MTADTYLEWSSLVALVTGAAVAAAALGTHATSFGSAPIPSGATHGWAWAGDGLRIHAWAWAGVRNWAGISSALGLLAGWAWAADPARMLRVRLRAAA